MEKKLNLNMSRIFKCDAKTLFGAVAEGMLFKYTGAKMSAIKIDFKVGGTLFIEWDGSAPVTGVFTEIKPFEKIVFTWDYETEPKKLIKTLVTILINEKNNKSTLTLMHDGFETGLQIDEHVEGWDDAIGDLHNSFRELYSKIEENPTGLDLYFKLKKTVNATCGKVFASIYDHNEITKFFGMKASADLVEGSKVQWEFKGHPAFTLEIHQVIDQKLIKFQWGDAHVCISFEQTSDNKTEVVIEATGWKADQKGLNESYAECEGWKEFLILLKQYVE